MLFDFCEDLLLEFMEGFLIYEDLIFLFVMIWFFELFCCGFLKLFFFKNYFVWILFFLEFIIGINGLNFFCIVLFICLLLLRWVGEYFEFLVLGCGEDFWVCFIFNGVSWVFFGIWLLLLYLLCVVFFLVCDSFLYVLFCFCIFLFFLFGIVFIFCGISVLDVWWGCFLGRFWKFIVLLLFLNFGLENKESMLKLRN